MKIFDDEEKNELFIQKGTELAKKTNGIFIVDEDKNKMDICLRGLIFESELVSYLKSTNVTTFSIRSIEQYISKVQDKVDVSTLALELELYKMLHM